MITYSNDCMLNVASCLAKGAITELHAGVCVNHENINDFDADKNGQITREEFAAANPSLTPEQTEAAFQSYDLNGDGVIDNKDFALAGDSAPTNDNTNVIVGATIGAFVGVVALAIVGFMFYKKSIQAPGSKSQSLLGDQNHAYDSRTEVI
jgi:Mg/Co/Ni transporter MgtE